MSIRNILVSLKNTLVSVKNIFSTQRYSSTFEYKSEIDGISSELKISLEGMYLTESFDIFMDKVDQRVQDLRAFNYQFEEDDSPEIEEYEPEEAGKIKPELTVKPKTSELDVKVEEQVRKSNMYG